MAKHAVTLVAHDVAGAGGMERQLRALIAGLLERGHRVTVVSRTLDLPRHPELRWLRVRGPGRPFVVAYPWFAALATMLVGRARTNVLHTTGAIILRRADVCTLHYLHNGRRRSSRIRRNRVAYRLNELVGGVMARAFERSVVEGVVRARTLVAVSPELVAELTDVFPSRGADMVVIRHGVDSDLFAPDADLRAVMRAELRLSPDDFVALFVGSEWRSKGLFIAVEALADVDDVKLVVVGTGDRAELGERVTALGLSDRVRVVGETAHPERFFAAADAFVLPSEHETFSLATIEAASSGLPVLTTSVGIGRDLTACGAGVLVDRDARSVAQALEGLRRDPARCRAMAACGREFARRYDWASAVDRYVELYQSLAAPTAPATTVTEAVRT